MPPTLPARPLPRALDLKPVAADAQDKDKDKPKLIPSTDQPPKTIPPAADKATDAAVAPGTPTFESPVRKPLCPVIKLARPAVQLCSP